MPDSIDASERMIDNWTRQVQESARKYQAMAARVEGMSVTERSADGRIELTVNAKGLLTDLRIAEEASGQRMSEVSAQILRTLRLAQSRIPELLQEAMVDTVGLGDAAAERVFDEARKTFPEPPEDEVPEQDEALRFDEAPDPPPPPPPSAQPPRRRASREDDDDDMGGSIFT